MFEGLRPALVNDWVSQWVIDSFSYRISKLCAGLSYYEKPFITELNGFENALLLHPCQIWLPILGSLLQWQWQWQWASMGYFVFLLFTPVLYFHGASQDRYFIICLRFPLLLLALFPQSIILTSSASVFTPVKISLMAVLIDFGKDFLQIKKLIGQCLCFRKILWFYLRRVIERSQCYYFLLENTCLVNLYIFNRQMICSHHFGMTIWPRFDLRLRLT